MIYLIRRILLSVPLIIAILFVSFCLMKCAPGDPANMYLDPRMNTSDLNQIRKNLALDKPITTQFLFWGNRVIHGDLGYSYTTGQRVADTIGSRLPATLLLSVVSLLVTLLVTFTFGMISAASENKLPDIFITITSFTGMSLPTFWIGLMLILIFSVNLDWLPVSGFYDPTLPASDTAAIVGSIGSHVILPVISSTISSIAALTRYYRYGMLDVLKQPYILAARSRGISRLTIIVRHAFKNAALPIATLLGLELPGLVSGAYIIEYIFAWPGLGQLGISSVFSRDYPVLMGTLLMTSILIVVGNLITDITYHYIDPRIRRGT